MNREKCSKSATLAIWSIEDTRPSAAIQGVIGTQSSVYFRADLCLFSCLQAFTRRLIGPFRPVNRRSFISLRCEAIASNIEINGHISM